MKDKGFQNILAWQKAHELALLIYQDFGSCKDWGFKDQIQRASVSVMNNIAEGHARRSDKSFRQFLLIAKGSLAEVQSMLILATDLGYISHTTSENLFLLAEETAKITGGLIRSLDNNGSVNKIVTQGSRLMAKD